MKEKINHYCGENNTITKILAVFVSGLIAFQGINAQDPKEILRKTLDSFAKFENISYEEAVISNQNGRNTNMSNKCTFWNDTTGKGIGVLYRIDYLNAMDSSFHHRALYDGKNLVNINYSMVSAKIIYIERDEETALIGSAVYSIINIIQLIKNTIDDPKITYELVNHANSADQNCYEFFIHDTTGSSILTWMDKHLVNCSVWIDKNTFFPVRYCKAREDGFDSVIYRNIVLNRETTGRMNAIDSIPDGFDRFENHEVQVAALNKGEYRYWKLPSVQNDTIDLTSLKGKIVVLDFSYVNCPSCIESIPLLNKLSTEFNEDEVVVLGVNPINKDLTVLNNYINKYHIQFKILLDKDESVSDAYLINAYPTLYILDKSGNVITFYVGYSKNNDDKIAGLIRECL